MKIYIRYISSFIIAVLFAGKMNAQNVPTIGTYSAGSTANYPANISNTTNPINTVNFKRIYYPITPLISVPPFAATSNLPIHISTNYMDGWDNMIQHIYCIGTQKDIVTAYDYRMRRTNLSLLPYPADYHSTFIPNAHSSQLNYYSGNYYTDGKTAPYVLSWSGNIAGVFHTASAMPGITPNLSDTIKMEFNSLPSNSVKQVNVTSTTSVNISGSMYANGTLTKQTLKGIQGRNAVLFTDKNGRLVCKKEYGGKSNYSAPDGYCATYYAYDDFGRLRAVLPPKVMLYSPTNVSTTNHAGRFYLYNYDENGNMIERYTPATDGVENTVFDGRNREVLVQSPNMAAAGKMYFNIYDGLGRVVMTGIYLGNTGKDVAYWHGVLKGTTAVINDGPDATKRLETWLLNGFQGNYPSGLYNCEIETINYYDSYEEVPANLVSFDNSYTSDYLAGDNQFIVPKPYLYAHGRLVATQSYIHSYGQTNNFTDTVITRVLFYDELGRIIQAHTSNPWGNWDVRTTQYNFSGNPILDINDHHGWAGLDKPDTRIYTKYQYQTNSGRLYQVDQKFDVLQWQKMASYWYDDMGRVIKKWMGGAEEQGYTYNVRGAITGINKDFLSDSMYETVSYASELSYESGYSQPRYEGKLSGYKWKSKGSVLASYGFRYDSMGRMIAADYLDYSIPTGGGGKTWNSNHRDYSVSDLEYDVNGNIMKMVQKGPLSGGSGFGNIDVLSYGYANNNTSDRVQEIYDAGNDSPIDDFKDSTSTEHHTDYTYDKNGNLLTDINKKIIGITYTHYDKPLEINCDNGNIYHTYSGSGTELQKVLVNGSQIDTYRYWGHFVYRNDSLKYILTPEGRARWIPDSSFFSYDYFVRDHQGNVRTVVTERHEYQSADSFAATFEIVASTLEEAVWGNIGVVRDISPTLAPTDVMVGLLDGCNQDKIIGASMLVHAMAGDQLNMQGYAYYDNEDQEEYNIYAMPETVLEMLTTSLFGGVAAGSEEGLQPSEIIEGIVSPSNFLSRYEDLKAAVTDPLYPHAYLNYLVFDENMELRPEYSEVKQVRGTPGAWQLLELDEPMTMPITGYILAYFSNESCIPVSINNVGFTRYYGDLLEEQHYYPHGLVVETANNSPLQNRYLFSGNEKQDELSMYDFHARQYDPQIGRFWGVDPLADMPGQKSLTPYHYAGNDPANFIDPLGLKGGRGSTDCWRERKTPIWDLFKGIINWIKQLQGEGGGTTDHDGPVGGSPGSASESTDGASADNSPDPDTQIKGGTSESAAFSANMGGMGGAGGGAGGIYSVNDPFAQQKKALLKSQLIVMTGPVPQDYGWSASGGSRYVFMPQVNIWYDLQAYATFFTDNSSNVPLNYTQSFKDGIGEWKEVTTSLLGATEFKLNGQSYHAYAEAGVANILLGRIMYPGANVKTQNNLTRVHIEDLGYGTAHTHMLGDLSFRSSNEYSGFGSLRFKDGPSPRDLEKSTYNKYYNVVVDQSFIYLYKGLEVHKFDKKTFKRIQ